MSVRACLRCGSSDLRMPTIRDGVAAAGGELTGQQVCRACGWRGVPAEFDDRRAHEAFLRGLREATEDLEPAML